MARLPSLFISHGMPVMALVPGPTGKFLTQLRRHFPQPRAILCISAHLEATHALVTGDAHPATLHDFGGFPPALHTLRYPAPGDPELAKAVVDRLLDTEIEAATLLDRGLDHGAWVPLSLIYPQAHIPVVQLSVQSDAPAEYHYRLGLALAPLRENGILILASGGATHDLSAMADFQRTDPAVDYAEEFDRWLEATISTGNTDALLTYRQSAPAAERNHPYPAEHFLPLLVAAGAGAPRGRRLHRHFEYGVLSLAAYRWD